MARKITLIEAQPRNPFGEESIEDRVVDQPGFANGDLPGYSDLVRRRELEIRKWQMGDRPDEPPPLPFRIQLARREGFDGKPDRRRVGHWEREGYRLATKDDIEGKEIAWDGGVFTMTLTGSSYRVENDGTVVSQDVVMMIATASVAGRRYRKVQEANEAQLQEADDRVDEASRRAGMKSMKEHKASKGVAQPKRV